MNILAKVKFSKPLIEISFLILMFLTLGIKSDIPSIRSWMEIQPSLFIRSFFWIIGLSVFPGLYVLRLLKILNKMSISQIIVISINLSFVIVGLSTLIFYYFNILNFYPVVTISGLMFFTLLYHSKLKFNDLEFHLHFSKWELFLILTIIFSFGVALLIQLSQRYLIAGDNWLALLSSIQIIGKQNVYSSYFLYDYPLMFGFILAGYTLCSGLPVVNTYVLFFPFVVLNILTFFVLLKTVFNFNDKISSIASFIYMLTGGLGWFSSIFAYNNLIFWKISDLTQDMYFISLWNSIQFSYKTMALLLSYSSLIILVIGIKFNERHKYFTFILSSLMILFSFYIHMLEPLIFAPLILVIIWEYEQKILVKISVFIMISIAVFLAMDFFMSGYYISLIISKLVYVLIPNFELINGNHILILIIIPIFIIFFNRTKTNTINLYRKIYSNNIFKNSKILFLFIIILIYLIGLYLWIKTPLNVTVYLMNPLPWYYFITSFGFIGFLALMGIIVSDWGAKWFKIASLWSLLSLLFGYLWWNRMLSYLYPVLALFTSLLIIKVIEKNTTLIIIINEVKLRTKISNIYKILAIIIILLSTSSVLYLGEHYISTGPSLTDNEATALLWINQNTLHNDTILTPNTYNVYKSIINISDRKVYYDDIPTNIINFKQLINKYNIRYIYTNDDSDINIPSILKNDSSLVFKLENIKIYKISASYFTAIN